VAEVGALSRALAQVVRFFEDAGIPYMVFGAVANLVWGEPRTTQDIDVKISVAAEEIPGLIAAASRAFRIRASCPDEFVTQTRVLPLETHDGVPVDVVLAGLPYEEQALQRAVTRDIADVAIRVATAEDLIVHKLVSERARDREDVTGVIRRQRRTIDRGYLDPLVRDIAQMLDDPSIWEWYRSQVEAHC